MISYTQTTEQQIGLWELARVEHNPISQPQPAFSYRLQPDKETSRRQRRPRLSPFHAVTFPKSFSLILTAIFIPIPSLHGSKSSNISNLRNSCNKSSCAKSLPSPGLVFKGKQRKKSYALLELDWIHVCLFRHFLILCCQSGPRVFGLADGRGDFASGGKTSSFYPPRCGDAQSGSACQECGRAHPRRAHSMSKQGGD